MLGRGQPRGRLQTTLGALVLACAASLLFLSVRIAFQQGGSAPRVPDFGSLPPAPPPAPLVPDVLEWEGDRPPPSVSVLLWDYSTWAALDMPDRVPTPNYVGHEVIKDKCPVPCRLFHDRSHIAEADGVLFEPVMYGTSPEWRRTPIQVPEKRAYQQWVMFGYETPNYFPLAAEPAFISRIDMNMTYDQKGAVPITFACNWGGGAVEDYLLPPIDFTMKTGDIAFIASNCNGGGALFRTRYVAELMEHIKVDSYGECLKNKEFPPELSSMEHYWKNPGATWKQKIRLLERYKFVLAFENNNLTDYVTEKIYNVWRSGAVPVYMGAPNIEDWTPGENSLIRTDQFRSPQALAEHLRGLLRDQAAYERYLQWKKAPLSDRFRQKVKRCVLYGAECRLCLKLAQHRLALPASMNVDELKKEAVGMALELDGKADWLKVTHTDVLDALTTTYTVSAWIRAKSFNDFRILDKNQAGTVNGIDFDIFKEPGQEKGFVRLCGPGGCWTGFKPLSVNEWYFVAAVVNSDDTLRFYVNGEQDGPVFRTAGATQPNNLDMAIGRAASGSSYWHGALDEVSLWNIALPAEAVRRMMYTRLTGSEEGLVGYWPLNEGKGDVVADFSRHKHHAQVQGAPRWVNVESRPLITHPCQ